MAGVNLNDLPAFLYGSRGKFKLLGSEDLDDKTFYFLTDTKEIYLGGNKYAANYDRKIPFGIALSYITQTTTVNVFFKVITDGNELLHCFTTVDLSSQVPITEDIEDNQTGVIANFYLKNTGVTSETNKSGWEVVKRSGSNYNNNDTILLFQVKQSLTTKGTYTVIPNSAACLYWSSIFQTEALVNELKTSKADKTYVDQKTDIPFDIYIRYDGENHIVTVSYTTVDSNGYYVNHTETVELDKNFDSVKYTYYLVKDAAKFDSDWSLSNEVPAGYKYYQVFYIYKTDDDYKVIPHTSSAFYKSVVSKKADKTYVDGKLETKADITYVDKKTAYSLKIPGLYSVANVLAKSWDELIEAGTITVVDNCITSSDLVLPDCKLIISDSVTSIGDRAFQDCTLTSITIPNSVTSIGDWAFSGCTSLTNITIPESIEIISQSAFDGCTSLTDVIIENGVKYIYPGAFGSCTSLKNITIPKSIVGIAIDAFDLCSSLTDVYYKGTKSDFSKIEIASGNNNFKNATIHYELTDEVYDDIAINKANIAKNQSAIEKNASDVAQNYANAVKGTGTGTAIAFDDVSPIVHKVKVSGTAGDSVNLYGKNLFITNPKKSSTGYEAVGSTIKITNPTAATFINSITKYHDSIVLSAGTYTLSVKAVGEAELASSAYFQIIYKLGDNSSNIGILKLNNKYSRVFTLDSPTVFSFNQVNMGKVPTSANLSLQIQLEVGGTATDFVEAVEGQAYTIDENGNAEIDSAASSMTILADSEVSVEYNRDTSKFINNQLNKKENKLVAGYAITISEVENEGEKRTIVHVDSRQVVDKNQYDSDMANKADRNYVDSLMSAAIKRIVIDELPTENIAQNTIYMVPSSSPSGNNFYNEFIYVNESWERIGSTEVDLSNYITSELLSSILENYAETTVVQDVNASLNSLKEQHNNEINLLSSQIQELTPTISSILPTTLVRNTEYYLGDVSGSITLAFPSSSLVGDYIYINFNATTDITLTIDTSNTSDIDIVPVSGTNYEIFATWNGSIWILGYNEYTVTTE